MGQDKRAAVLTKTSRRWLSGGEPPTHPHKVRQRTHDRLRNLITEDSELLVDHLEDGELNPDSIMEPLIDEYGYQELGHGIRDIVASLYIIGREAYAFDAEQAVMEGLNKGKMGRMEALEQKLERVGVDGMTVGELQDLTESDKLGERAKRELKQDFNLGKALGIDKQVREEFTEDG